MRRVALPVVVASIAVASLIAAEPVAAVDDALEGIYDARGTHSTRGRLTGTVGVRRAPDGRYVFEGDYEVADGRALRWRGVGRLTDGRVELTVTFEAVGMAGALGGKKSSAGAGSYTVTDGGLAGGWEAAGFRVDDVLTRRPAPPAAPAAPAVELEAARADLARIRELMDDHTDRGEEAEILQLLGDADPARLDWLVRHLDVHDLVEDVDDRLIGPDNRTKLLRLLSKDRLDDLSVPARAAVIDGLQKHRTGGDEERALADVLLGTRGADLTALKRLVDAGGDHHDLQQLIHHDLDDDDTREAILEHIAAEAKPTGELQVLSDIDDTLYASFKDDRFPGSEPYPGVRAFYAALDRSVIRAGAPVQDGGRPGDLAFVTARPGDRPGVVEALTTGMLEDAGLGHAVVLAGGFTALIGNERIAARKYENFLQFKALYPEYRFVFIGDSGQGDAIFGARMRAENGDAVPAVFIHDVVATGSAERETWREKGVFFFDSYAGAAVEAHALGLLTAQGLHDVVAATVTELGGVAFDSAEKRAAREAELRRDVERANAVLPESLRVRAPG